MQAIQAEPSETDSTSASTSSALLIHVGTHHYTFEPDEAPIVIGRSAPAQVIVGEEHVSRTHVRIDHAPAGWVATDTSKNGMYVNGERQSSITIHDGLVIRLGDDRGVAVAFGPPPGPHSAPTDHISEADEDEDEDDIVDPEVTDPGIAFAGRAVAARRDELGVTQRGLARDGIMNAGGLIGFEKGRRWPRPSTRAKLEQVLQWPEGHIAELRRQGRFEATQRLNGGDVSGDNSNTVRTSALTGAFELAFATIKTAIGSLPDSSDPAFAERSAAVLADLRRLEGLCASAATTTKGDPDIALVLGAVRKCYKDLMLRAARSPAATLGQQLYAARHRHELSVEETANAAGVPVKVIEDIEAGIPLDDKVVAAVSTVLAALNQRR
ncbi:MAG: FHA domain-containing protein [Mycobacterium sp.]|nr:FHA domain-containing protein [Mycobacterium sp.]